MAVSAGNGFSLFLTEDGSVYSCGLNTEGQLGVGDCQQRVQPVLVNHDEHIMDDESVVMVSAGGSHAGCVTEEGGVWIWGSNYCGQLGLPTVATAGCLVPLCVYNNAFHTHNSPAVMVACGGAFTLVLTASGQVMGCGKNNEGQLGTGDLLQRDMLTQIDEGLFAGVDGEPVAIGMVVAGLDFSMAISKPGGALWTWGKNSIGQLGHGTFGVDARLRVPTKMEATALDGRAVEFVAGGCETMLIVTSGGQLWGCGRGSRGQLGLDATQFSCTCVNPCECCTPTPLRIGEHQDFGPRGARMVACGPDHSLMVGHNNAIWSCGSKYSAALGTDTSNATRHQRLFTRIDPSSFASDSDINCIAAEDKLSVAVTSAGHLYTWGRNHETLSFGHGYASTVLSQWIPHHVEPACFGRSRIGRWHLTHPDRIIAFAMGLHARLGSSTEFTSIPPDMLREMVEYMRFRYRRGTSRGIRHLLGCNDD
jgi:alpha-tubulin suppressor-like RCC1 family protein